MLPNVREEQRTGYLKPARKRADHSLQIILWTLWTFSVVGIGYYDWRADLAGQRPLDLIGLVIHCAIVGVIGLIVLTLIEQRLERWRFLE
jgi:hypothetical protein